MSESRIVVIGGGLSGLAAAAALAEKGCQVTLLEARARLGGRAGSFTDAVTGQMVDACQHVSMGCCTNLAHFFDRLGLGAMLVPQPTLYFMTPDRRVSPFRADRLPAPFHLARTFLKAHYLTWSEKLRIAWGLAAMLRVPADADPPLLPWLLAHRQTERTIARFWNLILASALNESVDRVGLKYARKVFRDGFLRHRDGFTVHVPAVPLGRLYGDELRTWFDSHGVTIRENAAVRSLGIAGDRVERVILRDGSECQADQYVLAVPFERVGDLMPAEMAGNDYFAQPGRLQPSPITSAHFWYDRPVLDLPHVVLLDSVGQWVFNREGTYLQVVVSAAREFRSLGHEELQRRIAAELAERFPQVKEAQVVRARMVTEHSATFSAIPGVDANRPDPASPIANLAVAGDWTATGWPATMEGAVRSGYRAAEVVLERLGRPETLIRPDLGA